MRWISDPVTGAVEAYTRVICVSLVVNYVEHVGRNGLMTLGPKSEKRHRVPVRTLVRYGGSQFVFF